MAGEISKRRAWLTVLGSWFRRFRPGDGLWNDASVNHGWIWDEGLPSVELPAVFALADQFIDPLQLYWESVKRMKKVLPGTDRIAVGISQVGKERVVCLGLDDFVDILTDALLARIVELGDNMPPLFIGGPGEEGDGDVTEDDGSGETAGVGDQRVDFQP